MEDKEPRNNGKSCPHLVLAHCIDWDEATPRKAQYMCRKCDKKIIVKFEDETYFDVQEFV